MSLIHPAPDAHTAHAREVHVRPGSAARQVVHVVSDGTGRSPEEIWIFAAGLAAVAVTVAAVHGISRLVDLATDVHVWPLPPRRPSR